MRLVLFCHSLVLASLMADVALAEAVATSGLRAIRACHACRHRVDELLAIVGQLGAPVGRTSTRRALA